MRDPSTSLGIEILSGDIQQAQLDVHTSASADVLFTV